MSWFLLDRVMHHGVISYAMGGWAAPYGIEYRIDAVNAFVLLIVSGIAAVVVPYARTSVAAEFDPHRAHQFYAAFLLCLAGLLGVTITGDAFNLFVFLEISSLSSYVLIGLGRDRRALTAAYQYLVMGTIGATFIVIGIGLLYAATGTLNMADLATRDRRGRRDAYRRHGLHLHRGGRVAEARAVPAASVAARRPTPSRRRW